MSDAHDTKTPPPNWQRRRLGDLYQIPSRSGLYKSTSFYGRGWRMIHMPQMFRGAVVDDSDAVRVDVSQNELRRFGLESGDLLFARRSLSLEGAGQCSLVGTLGEPATFESSIIRVRLNKSDVLPSFANIYLGSEIGFRCRMRLIRQVAVSGVSSADIASIQIDLPPLPQQRKIARILTTLDNVIEKTETLIAKYQAIKQGLMHDLFTRGVDATGKLRPPQSEAPELYKQSDLGWIPKEWQVYSVGDLAEYVNGNSFNQTVWSTHGLPIIRIQNLNGNMDFNYYHGAVDSRWEVLPGDLLFAWSGMLETSFGPRIWLGQRGVLNQHIFKVVPNSDLVEKAFLNLLLRQNLQRIVLSAHGFKSSFVHVTRTELLPVPLAVPNTAEQDRILKSINKAEGLVSKEVRFHLSLKSIKTGLMQDLLTGKVRVNVEGGMENDEVEGGISGRKN